jgi:Domain of unknown function (DUF3471)
MKQVFLSLVLCLSAFSFVKAQGTNLAIVEQPITAATAAVNTKDSLQDYCGIYKMQNNPYIDKVEITSKNGQLVSKSPEDEEVIFEHTENDEFFIPTLNATVIFTRENDVVKSVKVTVQGKELVGDKL